MGITSKMDGLADMRMDELCFKNIDDLNCEPGP
jgi:hypothetical protein